MKKALLVLLSFLVFTNYIDAQFLNDKDTNKVDYNHWYATLNGGVMQFYGDISNDVYFPGSTKKGKFNPFINPKVGYNFNQFFGVQASMIAGSLWAEDDVSKSYFHAGIRDYQLEAHINLTTVFAPKRYNKKWHAFMNLGIGMMQYRTLLWNSSDSVIDFIGYDANEVKQKMQWEKLWSIGWGARYRLTEHLDIGLEVNLRKPPTDKLDVTYKNLLVYSEYDRYSYTGIELTYTFGNKSDAWQWNPKDPEIGALYDAIRRQKNNLDTLNKDLVALKKCKCEVETPEDFKDDDQDGVPNSRDLEPATPRGSLVNFQGYRIPVFDTTGLDIATLGKGGTGSGNGGNGGVGDPGMYFMSVYFPFDQTTIDAENYQRIVMIATYMMRHKDVKVKVSGNCDVRGTNKYNDDLAVRRSKAVIKILKKDFKIDENRLVIEGLSENQPISPVSHTVNRRVDFFIVK